MSAYDDKLDFWIKHNRNVLFEGSHGIGKTAVVTNAFNRAGMKWRYFSVPTMDPWVDFIGVPKEVICENGGESYLGLIRPLEFQDGSINALFFDEYNRGSDKVRDAVMELMQFKTINGRPIPGLRMVWGAVNPSDDEGTYKVEDIDPAQKDRFHIHTTMPCEPNREFFVGKYGELVGSRAVEWWYTLPENGRKLVTPRRLEYAVDEFQIGGDVRDVLSKEVRPLTLKQKIERVTVSASHADRWLTDPELYISEVSNRSKDNPIDVVEAFAELKDISMETAVAYIDQMSAPKINELAGHNATIGIVMRALRDKPKSRQLITAITRNAFNYSSASQLAEDRLNDIRTTDKELFAAVAACTGQAIAPIDSTYERLHTIVTDRITMAILEVDDCYMLFVLSADVGQNLFKTGSSILSYVENEYPVSFLQTINLRPQFACQVYK